MNCGFSVRESGVGGMAAVVPRARRGLGGVVGRRERMCVEGEEGEGWIYCCLVSVEREKGLIVDWRVMDVRCGDLKGALRGCGMKFCRSCVELRGVAL